MTEVDVANETWELFSEAYAQVHLGAKGNNRSLLVPTNVLLFRSEGAAVGVVKQDNTVDIRSKSCGNPSVAGRQIVLCDATGQS